MKASAYLCHNYPGYLVGCNKTTAGEGRSPVACIKESHNFLKKSRTLF